MSERWPGRLEWPKVRPGLAPLFEDKGCLSVARSRVRPERSPGHKISGSQHSLPVLAWPFSDTGVSHCRLSAWARDASSVIRIA